MSKKTIVSLIVLVVVLVVVGVFVGIKLAGSKDSASASEYSAVYLASGDLYFGKLSLFPTPRLKDVWVFQRGVDDKNNVQVGVVPFNSTIWGPMDELNLNPKEVIFWTRLRKDSQIVSYIENPQSREQQQAPQGDSQQLPPGNSTSSRGSGASSND
jgi:hypothetical protein